MEAMLSGMLITDNNYNFMESQTYILDCKSIYLCLVSLHFQLVFIFKKGESIFFILVWNSQYHKQIIFSISMIFFYVGSNAGFYL